MEEKKPLDISVGLDYKTRGGWNARVIWKFLILQSEDDGIIKIAGRDQGRETTFVVIHKPNTLEEHLAFHDLFGRAVTSFSVQEPPVFDVGHPADLMEVIIHDIQKGGVRHY